VTDLSAETVFLFVVLDASPRTLVHVNEHGAPEVLLEGVRYLLLERDAGFYDFLRNRTGEVIGTRFSFFDNWKILKNIAGLDYVYVDEQRQFAEVYFQGYRGDSVPREAEQSFGDDAIYRNATGVYVLQLGTSELSDDDIRLLREPSRNRETRGQT
jgi:hypothetical protein